MCVFLNEIAFPSKEKNSILPMSFLSFFAFRRIHVSLALLKKESVPDLKFGW